MGFTVLPYLLATGGSVTDQDMLAVTDQEFSQRNSHFIFTEPYKLGAAVLMGANITRGNIQIPTFNAIGRFNIWPVMKSSANISSPPLVSWFYPNALAVPQNEEFTVKATDGSSENVAAFMWMFTQGHSRNIPGNTLIIPVRCTSTITQVAGAWSAVGQLTFEQTLRGGVYSIIGAECVGSGTALWRLIFPRSRFYMGRRIRPGWLAQQAIGDLPENRMLFDPMYLGEWGRFHTFEPPQVEVFSVAGSSSIAHEFRLYLAYLGQDEGSLLDAWVSQGWQ